MELDASVALADEAGVSGARLTDMGCGVYAVTLLAAGEAGAPADAFASCKRL